MKDISDKLRSLGYPPFDEHSMNPKASAQYELSGRTHYVDDDTLRFFAGKILSARPTHDRLFYRIIESCKAGFEDYRRVYRVTYFDVFGQVVSERDTYNSRKAAEKADTGAPDVSAHYLEAIEHKLHETDRQRRGLEELRAMLEG
jgi:hypothetical protein